MGKKKSKFGEVAYGKELDLRGKGTWGEVWDLVRGMGGTWVGIGLGERYGWDFGRHRRTLGGMGLGER